MLPFPQYRPSHPQLIRSWFKPDRLGDMRVQFPGHENRKVFQRIETKIKGEQGVKWQINDGLLIRSWLQLTNIPSTI
jgi:hypothetical protein